VVRARGRPCGPPSGPTLAALRSARPGRPFGPPLVLRGGPKGRPGRPGGPKGRSSGRPFFEGRPERRPFFCKGRPHFEVAALWAALRPWWQPAPKLRAALRTAGPPYGPPDFGGWPPTFSGGPPELGQRAAPFGGWAAPVAVGRPAHQLGPIRPLTAHRFLTRRRSADTAHTDKRDKSRVAS